MKQDIELLRHSLAHVMASAVMNLYPKAKFGVGPSIENGFYYDFELDSSISEEVLEKIENEMKKIISSDLKFEREEMKLKDAIKLFTKLKQDYKVELLKDLEEKGTTKISEDENFGSVDKVSIYRTGEFVDLCRGPHVESTKELKDCAFKLTKLAGAYWRGSEKNKMLTRIYGVAFASQSEMDDYLKLLEEAERRDHRKIGKELDLFSFHEEAPGMPFFHSKGTIIWNKLVEFLTEKMYERNYEINKTPIILNKALWL
ncbi:MAG: threonine--tRNA ligase, partial [Patescibacteria group bacterium]|nr:threonine--tRNA ligase [Patescibacteria group bacterium]